MQTFQKRVIVERNELNAKLNNLRAFCGGDLFETLTDLEQRMLRRQLIIMIAYLEVLDARIDAFTV